MIGINPLTFDQIVALVSMLVAAGALVLSMVSKWGDDGQRQDIEVARQQMLNDKLDSISGMVSETRDDVRELRRMIDGHGREIAKLSQDVDGLRGRVKHLEIRMDDMQGR